MSQNPLKPDIVPLERPQRRNWDERFHKDVEQALIGPRYFSNPYSNVIWRVRCAASGIFEVARQKRGGKKVWEVVFLLEPGDVLPEPDDAAGR